MNAAQKSLLEKQGYRFVGDHSAVKICEWTKKSLRDEGVCYKQKFYGINCHRCCQMTCSMNYCDFNCVFCWRERMNYVPKKTDDVNEVIEGCFEVQKELLSGFGGLEKVNDMKLKEAKDPKHFAISLSGETLYYPKLNELLKELHKRGITSFVVSNGSQPDVLKNLERPTQLYISLDAPNEDVFLKVNRPSKKDAWKDIMRTLDILKEMSGETRTTLRITIVKGYNDVHPEQYAALLKKANAKFVEVKAYMFVGASRQRLSIDNMPRHHEVKEFAQKICEDSCYKIIDEQESSRVLLLMKEDDPDRIMRF